MKMQINLTKQMKVEFLSAIKSGTLDTEKCPGLSLEIDKIVRGYDPFVGSPLNDLTLEQLDAIEAIMQQKPLKQ